MNIGGLIDWRAADMARGRPIATVRYKGERIGVRELCFILGVKYFTFLEYRRRHGLTEAIAWYEQGIKPKREKPKREKPKNVFRPGNVCKIGDIVEHKGEPISVCEIIEKGLKTKNKKAYIVGNKIFGGQILKRSFVCAGYGWSKI